MKLSRAFVISELDRHRNEIKRLGVRRLALFGSVAAGNARPHSDMDFLVEFEQATFDGYMDLKAFLEGVFRRKVDLVLADALKPALRPRIMRQAVHVAGF
jgi:hypothetical protein